MYFWLGLSLSLAALLTLNALASLAAAALWRLLAERSLEWRAQDRSRAIFALRVAPIAGATLFVALLLLALWLPVTLHCDLEIAGSALSAYPSADGRLS